MEKSNLPIVVPVYKSNKEVIQDLVDTVFALLSESGGANMLMLRPALNIGKMKLGQMTEEEAENLIDQIHRVSHMCEEQTGKLSRYHV